MPADINDVFLQVQLSQETIDRLEQELPFGIKYENVSDQIYVCGNRYWLRVGHNMSRSLGLVNLNEEMLQTYHENLYDEDDYEKMYDEMMQFAIWDDINDGSSDSSNWSDYSSRNDSDNALMIEESDNSDDDSMAMVNSDTKKEQMDNDIWLAGSGASIHMAFSLEGMSNIKR